MVNKEYIPEVVILETSNGHQMEAKTMAMANGEDEVSVLSQLTEKTLKAATEAKARPQDNASSTGSVSTTQSGNTSKSKTQAAVKEVLKTVSLEHSRAMQEQHNRMQKEIEALRKELAQHTTFKPTLSPPAEVTFPDKSPSEAIMAVDEDSDDSTPDKPLREEQLLSPSRSIQSPAHKRPRRTKLHAQHRKGRSSSQKNDE